MYDNVGVIKLSSPGYDEVCKQIGNKKWRFKLDDDYGCIGLELCCDGPWQTEYRVFVKTMVNITSLEDPWKTNGTWKIGERIVFSQTDSKKKEWYDDHDIGKYNEFEITLDFLPLEESVEDLRSLNTKETEAHIKSMFSENSDISALGFKTSLNCPLSKAKIQWPCRSLNCKHIQPFDGKVFLQLNKHKKKWECPVCNVMIEYQDLRVDEYFQNILLINPGCNEVILNADGGWSPSQYKTKAFKLYNRDKTVKKMVVTTGVPDLILKGKEKFNYPSSQDVKVLLEEDGTQIDDDESLHDLERRVILC